MYKYNYYTRTPQVVKGYTSYFVSYLKIARDTF